MILAGHFAQEPRVDIDVQFSTDVRDRSTLVERDFACVVVLDLFVIDRVVVPTQVRDGALESARHLAACDIATDKHFHVRGEGQLVLRAIDFLAVGVENQVAGGVSQSAAFKHAAQMMPTRLERHALG